MTQLESTIPFNPHFTRTLSETYLKVIGVYASCLFQSSFYKDTLWNPKQYKVCFVIDGFQSSFYKDTLWNYYTISIKVNVIWLSILILQGHSLKPQEGTWRVQGDNTFNPHFTRTLSETQNLITLIRGCNYLSILILQGHSLKLNKIVQRIFDLSIFQSSFYKDTLWNIKKLKKREPRLITFNPHFTRTLSETCHRCARWNRVFLFQSSFYKDTLWNSASWYATGWQ